MFASLQRRVRSAHRDERGLSLTELLVVCMLLGLVLIPAIMFLTSSQRNQRTVDEAVRQQQDARLAMTQFAQALREASYPQGLTYSESSLFDAASDNDVTFSSDIDNDGIVERVRYYLDTATSSVKRVVTDPDCTQNPCSYGDTATSTTTTVITSVRNADLTACSGQSGSKPLFVYYTVDKGTGAQTVIAPGGTINNLVDIAFVKMTVVVDITPGRAPTCQTVDTAVTLRNWRG